MLVSTHTSGPKKPLKAVTNETQSVARVVEGHVADSPTGCIVHLGNTVQCDDRDIRTSARHGNMLTGEIKPVVDFIGDHNAVWKIPGDVQQSVDLVSTAHRSTRVVGIDEYQETDIIVHLGPDIGVVGLPLVRAVELVLDRLGAVHLRVGHVGWVVRTGASTLLPSSKTAAKISCNASVTPWQTYTSSAVAGQPFRCSSRAMASLSAGRPYDGEYPLRPSLSALT